jgi:hypothetical protein
MGGGSCFRSFGLHFGFGRFLGHDLNHVSGRGHYVESDPGPVGSVLICVLEEILFVLGEVYLGLPLFVCVVVPISAFKHDFGISGSL